jgi:acyl-CoA reductase-like NAD-dependent aldehyde dehydrogenase
VNEAVARGAKVHTGARYDGQIYYPTILTNVPLDAAIANEEIFGPVVVVEVVDTPEEAIAAANRTMYGLTSSILAGNRRDGRVERPQERTGTHTRHRTYATIS